MAFVFLRGIAVKIKLIAMDLDNTLLTPDHMTVSEKTKEVLLQAHKEGIKLAISTGRTLIITDYGTEQLPFVNYVVYSNGAGGYNRDSDSLECSEFINVDTALKIVDFIEKEPVFYDIYKDGRQHAEEGREKFYQQNGLPIEFIMSYMETTVMHKDMEEFIKTGGIEKINFFSTGEQAKAFNDFLSAFDNISCACPFTDCTEITNSKAKKGNALNTLCQMENISPEEVMAFGDSNNDITMLEFAAYSFAMANASEDCKKAAKYVTLSNAKDGVAAAVLTYALGA